MYTYIYLYAYIYTPKYIHVYIEKLLPTDPDSLCDTTH